MTSVAVIRALLTTSASVTELCPVSRIAAGEVGQGSLLPAISVRHVSTVPAARQDAQAEFELVAGRVQVTVLTKDYPSAELILSAVKKACAYKRGVIADVDVASIVRDTIGPDLQNSDATIFSKSLDLKVTYHEPN